MYPSYIYVQILTENLLPNAPADTPIPSPELAQYLQTMIWEVVTSYPRTGIYTTPSSTITPDKSDVITIFPNPATDILMISSQNGQHDLPFRVMNVYGQALVTGRGNSINISTLSPGCYWLTIGNQGFRFVKAE